MERNGNESGRGMDGYAAVAHAIYRGSVEGKNWMEWNDGKKRCAWANPKDEAYIRYHDEEWGIPVHDDGKLFEMLLLESFQAGLSWACILHKREHFRRAFDGFDAKAIAGYDDAKCEALARDAGIIRNRLKIRAAVTNAQIFGAIQREYGTFDAYLWRWTKGKTVVERGAATSPLSDAISEDLRKRGMKFVGATIIYSYLQAVGVLFSHEAECWRTPAPCPKAGL